VDVGIALPTMARGYGPRTTRDWCRGIDAGPFSSVSCGERVTFHNPDMMVTMAAAAALTERVRIFLNLIVLPAHPVALVAKQVATLDQLSAGRVTVGVGVGGREHDFVAAEQPFARRHARLDEQVAELRALWRGDPPFAGADPIGPAPSGAGGPPLLAGAMGPRAVGRAAAWADGITGFSLGGVASEMDAAFRLAEQAWAGAGRAERPRLVSGCFFVLAPDDDEARADLRRFAYDYLRIFGDGLAEAIAGTLDVASPARLRETLDAAEAAGCDEFILVPGTPDPGLLGRVTEVVAAR
jgi:alkanesulfonate monooxygenase SsuD/methylene tetrahydromethanopterin reductase-like flavin-dependent oxidoreductase (luciferase family)